MCFRPPSIKKMEKKCTKCETVNPPDADICSNCGAELPKAPMPTGFQDAVASSPPPGMPGGVTPPEAPPAQPAPPKTPPIPPKKPGI